MQQDNDFSDIAGSDATLRRFLHGLPGVDQVGAEARAAGLGTRSIKTTAKAFAIDLAIRMVDLTTLGGADTHGKVRALAAKAMHPDPADPSCPMVIPEPSDQVAHRLNRGSRGGRPVNFDAHDYKNRNVVERAFNHFKNWRGVATRYDKHALVYRGGVVLAAIML